MGVLSESKRKEKKCMLCNVLFCVSLIIVFDNCIMYREREERRQLKHIDLAFFIIYKLN